MRNTKKLRKIAAFLAALALSVPSIPFAVSGTDAAEETAYVSDSDLSDNGTADVDCFGAVPTAAQYDYQKQELRHSFISV